MKKFKEFISAMRIHEVVTEDKTVASIYDWINAVYRFYIDDVKMLIEQGVDINSRINKNNHTALLYCGTKPRYAIEIIKLLLIQPEIDVKAVSKHGNNFIDNLQKSEYIIKYQNIEGIINYDIQKKILENGREDIILFLEEYNLVHPKIKEKNPDLFKAKTWGLIS